MEKESIGKYISIARRAHASLLDKKLKPYGISHGQVMLLMVLFKNEGIYQQNLCDVFNLNKAAVGREIKKLQKNDFVQKKPDDEDKRKKLLFLTEHAKEFRPKLLEILNSVEKRIKENLSQEEINTFTRVLKKICDNLGVDTDGCDINTRNGSKN